MCDNEPQFTSEEMNEFRQSYGFVHDTSNPITISQMAWLRGQYRQWNVYWYGISPAELLMGCWICTEVPQVKSLFVPSWAHLKNFRKQTRSTRHNKALLRLSSSSQTSTTISRGRQVPGHIVQPAITPRSYLVNTPSGQALKYHRDLWVRIEKSADTSVKLEQELLLHILVQLIPQTGLLISSGHSHVCTCQHSFDW